jgi:hypothetical protein
VVLTLFDPDQHARAVDIIDLAAGHFRHAPARAIGGTVYGLVFDARRRFEQPADFLDTQHRWQFARKARQDQAPRQMWSVERYGEDRPVPSRESWSRASAKLMPLTERIAVTQKPAP